MNESDFLPDEDLVRSPDVDGALYFLSSGSYLLSRRNIHGAMTTKSLAPADVATCFMQAPQDSGWIDAVVRRHGHNHLGSWYLAAFPPAWVTLLLDEDDSIKVRIPGTLMFGQGTSYSIWAIKESSITEKSKVYHAPFPNVNGTGGICFGTNVLPEAHHSLAWKVWYLFFESRFNGDLASGKAQTHQDDVRKLLRTLNGKSFPVRELVDTGFTVGRLVDRCLS